MNTLLDPEIPDLDYASDSTVIFHGYYGLFVYDIKAERIVNSLNLKSIGCQRIQNGGPTEVVVSADGNTVFLYPYEKNYMYTYNLINNSIEKSEPKKMEDTFNNLLSSHDVLPDTDRRIQLCSNQAVSFSDGSFGHLYITGGAVSDILYVRDNKEWTLLTENDNPAPLLTIQDDSYYKAFSLMASESLESFMTVYERMFNLRDYAGICALTKDIEYNDDLQREWQNNNLHFISMEEIKPEENGRSCLKVEIQNLDNIDEPPSTSYIYVIHGDNGWYAEGPLHQEPPTSEWWEQ